MRLCICILITFSLSFAPVAWASHPKILASIPDLQNIMKEGASDQHIQDLILKQSLLQANITNVTDYMHFLKNNMSYKADEEDIWSAPLQTFARGYGDCEDLAFLTAEVLEHFGYQPRVLGFKEPKRAHVFVVVDIDEATYIFDNTNSVRVNVHTIGGIAAYLYTKHNIEYLVEVRRAPNQVRLIYSNQQLQQLSKK